MLNYQIIPVTPFRQNCTVFWDVETKQGAISDPGGDLDIITQFIDEQGIVLEKILCTHGHLDHIGGVAQLSAQFNLPIIGPHKDDLFWIEGLPEATKMFDWPPVESFEPDQWLEHGDKVEAANVLFDVIHCPGHTPGHVVFFQPEDRLALVGDVLFQGSIGRTDLPRGNHQDLIDSITKRLWPLGSDVRFVPGHGPMSTFGLERQTNAFVADTVLG